jgi:hypothetical protein
MKYVSSVVPALSVMGLILPLASAFGQTVTGSTNTPSVARHNPANVPAEYTVTPFGYFHPSCVQRLAKGESLMADGRIQHADGTVDETSPACNYPRYTTSGVPASQGPVTAPEVDGWVENASIATGSINKSYGALIATWTVPPHPRLDDGQVLYFFPGFQGANGAQTSILQPVLRWYVGQWVIASWNCCLNNITTESTEVEVRAGDVIYGSITSTCPKGTVSCAIWNVLSLDLSTGQSTTLSNTPSGGQVFNWAFGGVMETYFVNSCDNYPPDRSILFDNITVFDERLHPIAHPKWTDSSDTSQQPQCGYDVKAKRQEVKLDY